MARSRTSLHLCVKHGNPPFRPWRSIVRTRKPNMCARKQAIGLAKSGPHSACEHAIELNANFALGHFYLGIGLSLDGRHEEALKAIETGWRLSPRDPRTSTWLANKARVLYHLRRYEEAIETALSARHVRLTPTAPSSWPRATPNSGVMKRPAAHWPIYAPCQAATQ